MNKQQAPLSVVSQNKNKNKFIIKELEEIEEHWFKYDGPQKKEIDTTSGRDDVLDCIKNQDEFKNLKNLSSDEEKKKPTELKKKKKIVKKDLLTDLKNQIEEK
ncbi:conserved protein, unknown function, partial [Hepatocystis sp. ex Piliocolobus tephrosceles]